MSLQSITVFSNENTSHILSSLFSLKKYYVLNRGQTSDEYHRGVDTSGQNLSHSLRITSDLAAAFINPSGEPSLRPRSTSTNTTMPGHYSSTHSRYSSESTSALSNNNQVHLTCTNSFSQYAAPEYIGNESAGCLSENRRFCRVRISKSLYEDSRNRNKAYKNFTRIKF